MNIRKHFFRKAPEEYHHVAQIPSGGVAITHRLVDDVSTRRKMHGKWVEIKSEHGSIYRSVSFTGSLKGTPNNDDHADIVIDWVGWLHLHGYADDVNKDVELEIKPAGLWGHFMAFCKHPDPSQRLANIIAIISFSLGLALGSLLS